MNWNEALRDSAIWLVQAYAVTLLGFVVSMAVLVRTTQWGRQFWRLSGAFFDPRRNGRRLQPLAWVGAMLLFVLLAVRMNVLFSYWYNGFYSGLQALDATSFWFHLKLFGVLASVHVVRAVTNVYIRGAFSIQWRQWLNERLVSTWLNDRAYYLGRFVEPPVDNPEQRIQQDAATMVTESIGLYMGSVSALVSIWAFTGILWNLSAPMSLFGTEVPRAMVFLVYAYVLVATVFAVWVGRPLVALNFLNEKLNATYRYLLMRLREYGESVALYRGEGIEHRSLAGGFASVITNAWALLRRTMKFEGFNLGISQAAVVFPFLIQGPRLFAGQIKLGDVMQTSEAFGQVQDALSFFRTYYDSFAGYRAMLDRLTGFEDNVTGARNLSLPQVTPNAQALVMRDLTVLRPDGRALLQGVSVMVAAGEALLIRGPSGSGKTTLLRTLAGLWPFSQGHAERPVGTDSLFLSQRPYLPLGSLRGALAYPGEGLDDATAQAVLADVQLAHLVSQLDVAQDWSQVLSPGEQQRLAFGRVLANRPAIVFLDEATSAADGGLEHHLYTLLRQALPRTIVVSVGHRETLLPFHDRTLTVGRDGSWLVEPVVRIG